MHSRILVAALMSTAIACEGPAGPAGATGPSGGMPLGYLNVLDFGAQPNTSSFDNSASFQRALDSAARAGGGVVWVPMDRFWFAGNITIGVNVALAGAGVGPYDPGSDGISTTVAPTLLATSTTGPAFITIGGENSALQDLLIRYPNQVAPNAAGVATGGPTIYPTTVLVSFPSKIFRCTLANSYTGIDVEIGRVILENLDLGAFRNDIIIDNAEDFVQISHITISPAFWDVGATFFPQPIDSWVSDHGVALTSYRADALSIVDLNVFWRNTGIALLDSPQGHGNTYGTATGLDIEITQYGVIAKSTNQIVGFEFTNLAVGVGAGANMIWLPAGGSQTPRVVVEGGVTWGTWAQPLKVDAGTLVERDITGLNPIGWLPALGLSAPTLPASGVAYVSTLPTVARVSISGGSVQDVQVHGQSTGLTSGSFQISPGESIAVIYASAPTWGWNLE